MREQIRVTLVIKSKNPQHKLDVLRKFIDEDLSGLTPAESEVIETVADEQTETYVRNEVSTCLKRLENYEAIKKVEGTPVFDAHRNLVAARKKGDLDLIKESVMKVFSSLAGEGFRLLLRALIS